MIPVIRQRGLYDYLQGVQAYLAPPIFVVFFLGVFLEAAQRRLPGRDDRGLYHGLSAWRSTRPAKLIDGFAYEPNSFLWIVNNMFFQYYSILILIARAATMVAVSLTVQPDYDKISG